MFSRTHTKLITAQVANTLSDFPPDQYTLMAYCEACDHASRIVVKKLPGDLTVDRLRQSLRCGACGHKGAEIRIIFSGSGEFHYGQGKPAE